MRGKVDLWLGESTPSISVAKRIVSHPLYRSRIRDALWLVKPDFRLRTKLPGGFIALRPFLRPGSDRRASAPERSPITGIPEVRPDLDWDPESLLVAHR